MCPYERKVEGGLTQKHRKEESNMETKARNQSVVVTSQGTGNHQKLEDAKKRFSLKALYGV